MLEIILISKYEEIVKKKKWLVVILICKTSPRVQSGNQPIPYTANIPMNATRLLPMLQ